MVGWTECASTRRQTTHLSSTRPVAGTQASRGWMEYSEPPKGPTQRSARTSNSVLLACVTYRTSSAARELRHGRTRCDDRANPRRPRRTIEQKLQATRGPKKKKTAPADVAFRHCVHCRRHTVSTVRRRARVVDGLKHLSAPACRFSTASTTPQPHRASQYTQSGTRGDGTVCMLPEQSPRAAMVKSPDFAGVGCPARLSRARRLPPACSVPCLFLRTSPPWDVPGFP